MERGGGVYQINILTLIRFAFEQTKNDVWQSPIWQKMGSFGKRARILPLFFFVASARSVILNGNEKC